MYNVQVSSKKQKLPSIHSAVLPKNKLFLVVCHGLGQQLKIDHRYLPLTMVPDTRMNFAFYGLNSINVADQTVHFNHRILDVSGI
jgi:hypothetical protein